MIIFHCFIDFHSLLSAIDENDYKIGNWYRVQKVYRLNYCNFAIRVLVN